MYNFITCLIHKNLFLVEVQIICISRTSFAYQSQLLENVLLQNIAFLRKKSNITKTVALQNMPDTENDFN